MSKKWGPSNFTTEFNFLVLTSLRQFLSIETNQSLPTFAKDKEINQLKSDLKQETEKKAFFFFSVGTRKRPERERDNELQL